MNIIISGILIGTAVGFIANMIETPFEQKNVVMSVFLGIIGATLGGVFGEFFASTNTGNISMTPLLYIVMGSFLSAMVPSKSNIL